jgi:hypothetical protein
LAVHLVIHRHPAPARMAAWLCGKARRRIPSYAHAMRRPLTVDLSQGDKRPYFLWDEDVSIDELKSILGAGPFLGAYC